MPLRRPFVRLLPALLAPVLLLCGCSSGGEKDAARRERETNALCVRVEVLERQTARDRADIVALQQEVESLRAGQAANAKPGGDASEDAAAPESGDDAAQAQPAETPHATLRETLRGAYERSRRALERLRRDLDRALTRKSPGPAHRQRPQDNAE